MLRPHDAHPSERRELAHLARRGAEMDRLDELADLSERRGHAAAAETYRGLLAEMCRMTWASANDDEPTEYRA